MYDPKNSKNYIDLLNNTQIEFGSGTIAGDLGMETVYISDLVIKNVTFISVTKQTGKAFELGGFDGLIGLSFPQFNQQETIIDKMIQQRLIDKAQFSFYLDRTPDSNESQLIFGGYNTSLYEGEIFWHKVVEKNFWTIQCQKILIANEDTHICSSQMPCKLIIDSGTSLITGPINDIKILYDYLDYYQDSDSCKNILNLPTITFIIDNMNYTLNSVEYILSLQQNGKAIPYIHTKSDDALVDCIGIFQPFEYPTPIGPLWIMGDIFMSKYYTIFDRDQVQIGLAIAKMRKN